MSSVWSNFTRPTAEAQQAAVCNPNAQKDNGTIIFSEIVAETKGDLAFIEPQHLRRVDFLGSGNSFQVTREILHQQEGPEYYVAVKHVVTRTNSAEELEKRFSSVRRELRVLMHPPLRSNSCVISILGYGWKNDPLQGISPYLVMDYSGDGTLRQFLQTRKIPLSERRELASDVGMALRSLHDCHIIHGDVKIDNVLVFGNADDKSGRPQVAKLADFGCAFFEDDFVKQPEVYYLGTTRYNAPEIASRTGPGVAKFENSFDSFKKADAYSFGLLLVEVALNGGSFVDEDLVDQGETVHAFLARVAATREDYMLELVLHSVGRLPSEDPFLVRYIKDTLELCLRDNASRRGSLDQITKTLSQGTDEARPQYTGPIQRSSPLMSRSPDDSKPLKRNPGTVTRLMPPSSENLTLRAVDPKEDYQASNASISLRSTHLALPLVHVPRKYQYEDLDMFRVSMTISPTWDVQCRTAERLKNAVVDERDPVRSAFVHLQLSVVYHIGYGTLPDASQTMINLAKAATYNEVAKCIYPRVAAALKCIEDKNRSEQDADPDNSAYDRPGEDCPSMGILNLLRVRTFLKQMPNGTSDRPAGLHKLLITACKNGDYVLANSLIPHCKVFPPEDAPNPLHWLVMFSPTDAKALLRLLVVGSSESNTIRKGICHLGLDSSCEAKVSLPEYCMELVGTPLHWAARCGYLDLVNELILHGADINKRWKGKIAGYGDLRDPPFPSFSPLDVAVAYHFAEIAETLLDNGADTYGGDYYWKFSPFHMIGRSTIPFERYVAHGHESRTAAIRTIRTLLAKGLDIDILDSVGRTPLICATRDHDSESYIMEELLAAGASAKKPCEEGGILAQAARCCVDRRFISKKLSVLLDHVDEANDLDKFGRNALHYCALFDGAEMARILLARPNIDIDCKASDGNTALTYTAKFGSKVVANLLIDSGASLEKPDRRGDTPLCSAVNSRHLEVARLLIKTGAKILFGVKDGAPSENILHVAVRNASNRGSVAKQILEMLSPDAIEGVLNAFNSAGWTPLHVAAYFGDIQGVQALLQAGADCTLYKFPQRPILMSQGGTPFQLVCRLIEKTKERGLGVDHKAFKRDGEETAAANHFLSCLEEVQVLLSKGSTR